MESGLSTRIEKTLMEFKPAFATASATPQPKQHDSTATVDLSCAQNKVLRPELLEFFKSTVEDNVTSSVYPADREQVFDLPAPNGGDPVLREALASFFNNYFHPIHSVRPEHIVLTAGASDAIENVIHTVCDDGDSVLVPGPSWHGFIPLLKARANVNIVVAQPPTYDNWDNYLVPSLQTVYDCSSDKSRIKAVLLCNPHNPLSRCYPKKTLLELLEFCQEHNLHLIVDEIYALTDLSKHPQKAAPFVSILSLTEPLVPEGAVKVDPSRVHTIWSASKLFGLSGFRVVPSYCVLAACLVKHGIEFVEPSHGLFLFARLARRARCAGDEEAVFEALARGGVRVAEGRFYTAVEGDFGWARICFSVGVEVMQEAVGRIEAFLTQRGSECGGGCGGSWGSWGRWRASACSGEQRLFTISG
ncbi:pyridoxal phosphate-dependent transferase [Phaeosphaeriaceae sp. PMI808]|nr:pyridoxal phosphate-dependent transferase [Phaeosphaeriaceae sp. PMI808]